MIIARLNGADLLRNWLNCNMLNETQQKLAFMSSYNSCSLPAMMILMRYGSIFKMDGQEKFKLYFGDSYGELERRHANYFEYSFDHVPNEKVYRVGKDTLSSLITNCSDKKADSFEDALVGFMSVFWIEFQKWAQGAGSVHMQHEKNMLKQNRKKMHDKQMAKKKKDIQALKVINKILKIRDDSGDQNNKVWN